MSASAGSVVSPPQPDGPVGQAARPLQDPRPRTGPDQRQGRGRTRHRRRDLVGLYNDRGTIIAGAVVSDGIMPGVVSICEEGWPSLDGKGRCNSGLVTFLTSTRRASGLSQATTANTASCSMRKCEDPKGPNMAYEKPEIIEDYGIAEIDEDLLGLDRLYAITESL